MDKGVRPAGNRFRPARAPAAKFFAKSRASPSKISQEVLIEAWIEQKTEWTKSIFSLSSAGLGLIATFAASEEFAEKLWLIKVLAVIAGVSFAVSAAACLVAFQKSAESISINIEKHAEKRNRDADLDRRDKEVEGRTLN
ncbi:hypothetical protein [Pseudaquabacterium rugosum]|uniref:Uncharacterized protein n=1 Tax=Pseudaquabacterium rugosum TaxID=2984194 RepID=A0ABU9B9I5_9BURK